MITQKNITILLLIVIGILSYQTVTLASLNGKLKEVKIFAATGAPSSISASSINLGNNGQAPQMVGGC